MPNIYSAKLGETAEWRRARLGEEAGSEHLGLSLYELAPGQAMVFHYHVQREELLIVLSGRLSLRTGEGWEELPEGEIAASYLVVETGPWIFGKRVLLPAGIVDQIDEADGIVYVNHTKEEIKNAPEYDPDLGSDERYRTELGDYYSAQVSGGMRAASTPLE